MNNSFEKEQNGLFFIFFALKYSLNRCKLYSYLGIVEI